jgi:hypothetical protein
MVNWVAYLSDGQAVKQKDLEQEDSTVSPWLKLLQYLSNHPNLEIRNIQLISKGRVFNTPSMSHRSNFPNDGNPCNLWCFQKYFRSMSMGSELIDDDELFMGIAYKVGEYYHYIWVNQENGESFTQVKHFSEQNEQVIEKFYNRIK